MVSVIITPLRDYEKRITSYLYNFIPKPMTAFFPLKPIKTTASLKHAFSIYSQKLDFKKTNVSKSLAVFLAFQHL